MNFDYITLTRRCNELWSSIIKSELLLPDFCGSGAYSNSSLFGASTEYTGDPWFLSAFSQLSVTQCLDGNTKTTTSRFGIAGKLVEDYLRKKEFFVTAPKEVGGDA